MGLKKPRALTFPLLFHCKYLLFLCMSLAHLSDILVYFLDRIVVFMPFTCFIPVMCFTLFC